MEYIFEGKILSEDTLRMIYKTSFDYFKGRSFEQYVEYLQKANIIIVIEEGQGTEKGRNIKDFSYIVVAECILSKFEPKTERIIAGFEYYVNAEDFLTLFSEEQRKVMEIRKV